MGQVAAARAGSGRQVPAPPQVGVTYAVGDGGWLSGDLGPEQPWGRGLPRWGTARLSVPRPVEQPLTLLLGSRSGSGRVEVTLSGPTGRSCQAHTAGTLLVVDLGAGAHGSIAEVSVTPGPLPRFPDTGWSELGLESIVLLPTGAPEIDRMTLARANEALEQQCALLQQRHDVLEKQLRTLTTSRSWRLTAPLRAVTGRPSRSSAGDVTDASAVRIPASPSAAYDSARVATRRTAIRAVLRVRTWALSDPRRHDAARRLGSRVPLLKKVATRARVAVDSADLTGALWASAGGADEPTTDAAGWEAVLLASLDRR